MNTMNPAADGAALCKAAQSGDVSAVEMILEGKVGASLEDLLEARIGGSDALHYACQAGSVEIVSRLLSCGAHVDSRTAIRQSTPLHLASENGHDKIVRRLLLGHDELANQKHLKATDSMGWTCMHSACWKGQREVVRTLLLQNASETLVIAADREGWTPLHMAAINGFTDILELLLNGGADVNVRSNDGNTPLMRACLRRHEDSIWRTINFLIEKGADVNQVANIGRTAVHWASRAGNLEAVKVLLEHGADYATVDRDGATPRQLAWNRKQFHVVAFLDQYKIYQSQSKLYSTLFDDCTKENYVTIWPKCLRQPLQKERGAGAYASLSYHCLRKLVPVLVREQSSRPSQLVNEE